MEKNKLDSIITLLGALIPIITVIPQLLKTSFKNRFGIKINHKKLLVIKKYTNTMMRINAITFLVFPLVMFIIFLIFKKISEYFNFRGNNISVAIIFFYLYFFLFIFIKNVFLNNFISKSLKKKGFKRKKKISFAEIYFWLLDIFLIVILFLSLNVKYNILVDGLISIYLSFYLIVYEIYILGMILFLNFVKGEYTSYGIVDIIFVIDTSEFYNKKDYDIYHLAKNKTIKSNYVVLNKEIHSNNVNISNETIVSSMYNILTDGNLIYIMKNDKIVRKINKDRIEMISLIHSNSNFIKYYNKKEINNISISLKDKIIKRRKLLKK